MTETPNDQPLEAPEAVKPAAAFDAPDDVAEDIATGYKVYDRTLGRYVGPMHDKRPSKTDAGKLAGKGHVTAVVRV